MSSEARHPLASMSLYNLSMVVDALRTGDLTRVARDYSVTQPAVSYHIKRLEKALGSKLLLRKGNHFYPSKEGEKLIEVLKSIEFTKMYFLRSKSKSGEPRKKIILPDEMADLFVDINGFDLDVEFSSWDRLTAGGALAGDLSLVPSLISDEASERPLPSQQLVWMASGETVRDGDFQNIPIAFPVGVSRMLDIALEARRLKLADRIEVKSNSFVAIRAMLSDHKLMGLLPACMLRSGLEIVVRNDGIMKPIEYYYDLIIDRQSITPREENFIIRQIGLFLEMPNEKALVENLNV